MVFFTSFSVVSTSRIRSVMTPKAVWGPVRGLDDLIDDIFDGFQILRDLLGLRRGTLRELTDFLGDDGEALAVGSGVGGFDGRVHGEKVRSGGRCRK